MNDINTTKQQSSVIIIVSIIIALGMTINGFFIGWFISKFKTNDRSIIVKGFSEKNVKSDLAELTLTFKNPDNDLITLQQKNEEDTKIVLDFLQSKGILLNEISIDGSELLDRQAREYVDREKSDYRYMLTTKIKINTDKVDLIKDINNKIVELIKNQINIGGHERYYFTKFADLRTKMIAEATQSARTAAMQFAKDSGSKVGEIRNAVQGAFSITGPNEEYYEASSIYKKIRVVTTVTFNIID